MKILTALNDINLNKRIKKDLKEQNILKDLIYKEGIIEYLKVDQDIDLIIINNSIPGEIDIYTLIKEILDLNKYIEVIVILENEDIELRKFLSGYSIEKILIDNKYNYDDLLKLITNDNSIKQKALEKELNELRKLVFEREENTFKNRINKKVRKVKEDLKNKKKSKLKIKENKQTNKGRINKKDKKIYISFSEDIQKYNISSIDITVRVRGDLDKKGK